MSSGETPDVKALEAELAAMIMQQQQQQQQEAASGSHDETGESSEYERSYPSEYISRSSAEFERVQSLWQRFARWIASQSAEGDLILNSTPAPPSKMFPIQSEFASVLGDEDWSLPEDVLASYACHDGQDWNSTTGILGRWYLLDCQTMFTEWRDQKEMMEMGLYTGSKYTQARKSQPRHPRIDTSYWFNSGWIPIACSRGANLGGDLICIDMAPILRKDVGQVILYMTESPERIVIANSFGEWLEACVKHLEAGVYRFDTERHTYAAGREETKTNEEGESETKEAPPSAPSSSSSSEPFPTVASNTIGVEAFMYSALEQRDFFIKNQTEALVYLPDNDFGLLATDGLTDIDNILGKFK